MAAVGCLNGRLRQSVAGQREIMILFIHQQRFNLEVLRTEGIRQIVLQRMRFATRQMNTQDLAAVQLIHKLTTVTAGGVVDGNGIQRLFAAQPRVANGALLGVHGLLHRGAEELHVAAKIPATANAASDGANVKMGEVGARTGRRERQQRKGQRVFIKARCVPQRRDLAGIQQSREVRVDQHRCDGRLQVCRQKGKSSLKTWVHGVAS